MKKIFLPFFLSALFLPILGCGGAPETDVKGNAEMEKLGADPDYEDQMMGDTKTE